jgi:phosphopantothenoylcysteine decarboxylase/phosphopantothenate--cysteine ligase
VTRTSVETARQMLAACESVWEQCDALYAVAAVADYRPAEESVEKLKRSAGEGRVLRLVENPDVVATLAARKAGRRVIGFALESRDGETEARRKMQAKGLDFVCLNGPEAQGAAAAALVLLGRDGSRRLLGPLPKEELARALVSATLPPAGAPG